MATVSSGARLGGQRVRREPAGRLDARAGCPGSGRRRLCGQHEDVGGGGSPAGEVSLREPGLLAEPGGGVEVVGPGIKIVGRSQRLTLNYRTTAENLAYGLRILSGGTYTDLEDQPEDSRRYRSARRGPNGLALRESGGLE